MGDELARQRRELPWIPLEKEYRFETECPKDVSTMNEWPRTTPCELPADRNFEALAEALGKPSPSPPE
jgi:hypothetical protein